VSEALTSEVVVHLADATEPMVSQGRGNGGLGDGDERGDGGLHGEDGGRDVAGAHGAVEAGEGDAGGEDGAGDAHADVEVRSGGEAPDGEVGGDRVAVGGNLWQRERAAQAGERGRDRKG